MQAASRQSYAAGLEQLDGYASERSSEASDAVGVTAPGASPEQLRTVAEELLATAGLLAREVRLRRALSDPARSGADRAGLLRGLLGDRVGEATRELLDTLVAGRWSAPSELLDGCEQLGVQALLASADRAGALAEVEDELFRFGQVVSGDPELASVVGDRSVPVERRAGLTDQLLSGATGITGQAAAGGLVATLARLRVTGDVPAHRPLILAANHISPFDPIALTAACRRRRIAPRFLAAGELFAHPVLGPVMRHWGHIPVHRGTATATQAVPAAAAALTAGSVVVLYPEGGIGLDPGLWPQRGRTGVGRLALTTGAEVVPVALWGAHEVVPYSAPRGLLRALPGTIRRRPVVRVQFGAPVDLSGLRPDRPGDARRATDRIVAAITAQLVRVRVDEPDRPRHVDPTRPTRAVPSEPDPLAQE